MPYEPNGYGPNCSEKNSIISGCRARLASVVARFAAVRSRSTALMIGSLPAFWKVRSKSPMVAVAR